MDDDELYDGEQDDGLGVEADDEDEDGLEDDPDRARLSADLCPPKEQDQAASVDPAVADAAFDELARFRRQGELSPEAAAEKYAEQKAEAELEAVKAFIRADAEERREMRQTAEAFARSGQDPVAEVIEEPVGAFHESVLSDRDFKALLRARAEGLDSLPEDKSPGELNRLYQELNQAPPEEPDRYADSDWDA